MQNLHLLAAVLRRNVRLTCEPHFRGRATKLNRSDMRNATTTGTNTKNKNKILLMIRKR